MTTEQLNMLAVRAKNGCDDSRWQIKAHFQRIIHDMSTQNHYRINEVSFEESSFQRIDEAIRKFDPAKGNFRYQVEFRLKKLLHQHIKRNKESLDRAGISMKLDIYDSPIMSGQDMERDILIKEMIATLAGGDQVKEFVLRRWSEGFTVISDLADRMSELFGGKSDSYRKCIDRLRKRCTAVLSKTA